jgi:hypothetical protein
MAMSSLVLDNGDFDGWSFAYDFNATPPAAPWAAPVIGLSEYLPFGNEGINHTATQTLTIRNVGASSLTVNDIAYPPGFSGSWAGGNIPAGGSQTVTVAFSPTLVQGYGGTVTVSGTITLNSASTSVSNTFTCSGTGINAVPAMVQIIGSNGFRTVSHKNQHPQPDR